MEYPTVFGLLWCKEKQTFSFASIIARWKLMGIAWNKCSKEFLFTRKKVLCHSKGKICGGCVYTTWKGYLVVCGGWTWNALKLKIDQALKPKPWRPFLQAWIKFPTSRARTTVRCPCVVLEGGGGCWSLELICALMHGSRMRLNCIVRRWHFPPTRLAYSLSIALFTTEPLKQFSGYFCILRTPFRFFSLNSHLQGSSIEEGYLSSDGRKTTPCLFFLWH